MRKLTFGMNVSVDGYIAAPGDDLGWSVPSDELFQWWSDRVGGTGLALYGRKLWETMSPHWPTADRQPGATPAQIEFARRWRDMPKVVFSSTTGAVDGNARLVTGDAVTEITRLKSEDGGPMDIGGATLAAAAMRAGLIDEYVVVTHPVLVGGGTPFFTDLDSSVSLNLVETRLKQFKAAYNTSDDMDAYNRVQAVERALGRVQDYVGELADASVKLAGLPRPTASHGPATEIAFEAMRDAKVITARLCSRLVQAQNARTRIEHSYVQTPAGDVHRAAILVRDTARDLIGPYRHWIEPFLAEPEP